MQVAVGKVINGKIVSEGTSLREGDTVAILAHGADESFRLTKSQEEELSAAVRDIESGSFVTLKDLLDSLSATA
jgi:sulfur carrier protein ThiS